MKKMLKKAISILLAAVVVLGSAPLAGFMGLELPDFGSLFAPEAEAATEYESGYYTYEVYENGEATITDVDTSISGDVIIPSTLGGYPVTRIGYDAFADCTDLTSVTIPDSVTSISYKAFYDSGVYNDASNWENDVFYIGDYLIDSKETLSGDYVIKNGTKVIADGAFSYCYNLTSITIPDSVTSICMETFDSCTSLESITIPDSVTSIGDCAFWNCTSLESITIPDSVISIGYEAFYDCERLTSVTIGNSVISIGDFAFCGCTSLASITIPDSVTSIGDCAFWNCTSLESITIPDSVTIIGLAVFVCCTSLTSVSIGNSVTSIGACAFDNCTSLTSVTIPDSVTTIDYLAFCGCESLTSITIPDSVTSIGHDAFYDCTRLESITIPDSVTSIGDDAFCNCESLTDVYYTGSETEWNAISIGSCNEDLLNATIHFNASSQGGEATPPGEEDYSTQNIKVMSYNVYVANEDINGYDCSYETRLRYVAQSINDNMPDSIGLQEVTSDMRFMLESYEDLNGGILAANYEGVGDYRSKSGNNNEASLIYYNKNKFSLKSSGTFWLSESGEKYSKHSKADYPRICTYALLENKETGLGYLHVNTHIEHDHTGKDKINSNEAAIFSSKKIIDFVNRKFPDVPIVITGDFNQKEGSVPYNNFIDAGYTDTRIVYGGNVNTYSNCYKGGSGSVIDHIFVNDYFADGIKSYTVYNEDYSNSAKYGKFALDYPYPSDHHPVVVELEMTYSKKDILIPKDISFKEGIISVKFRQDWFKNDSLQYNHSLAQLCSQFVTLGYNTDSLKNGLTALGFNGSQIFWETKAEKDKVDNFIANRDITVNGETYTLLFVGCIGTNSVQWYSNFEPGIGETHASFNDAKNYVYDNIKNYIDKYGIDTSKTKILLCGHSRGAATANLLAAELIDEQAFAADENIYTYTFATPNPTSSKKITDEKYDRIFNFVNPEDFVTKVIPAQWGYGRYGITYTLPSKENTSAYNTLKKNMQAEYDIIMNNHKYHPYPGGESQTYDVVQKLTSVVKDINKLYSKKFNWLGEQKSIHQFFAETVCKYMANEDGSSGRKAAQDLLIETFVKRTESDSIILALVDYFILYQGLGGFTSGIVMDDYFTEAHQAETYCAYMMSMTSSQATTYRKAYKNTVNCPVDIEIYDKVSGELVGKIVNNVVDEEIAAKKNSIVMYVEGDSKSFWLPSNGEYDVKLIGNDDGVMDYTVSKMDSSGAIETQRVNFVEVEIVNDKSMSGEFIGEDFILGEYSLVTEDGNRIENDDVITPDNADKFLCEIGVSIEGDGVVSGDGTYTKGDYVTLYASCSEIVEFIGWYNGTQLVSKEANYSFVVKESSKFIAKFEKLIDIRTPSTTTVNYGDSIILHADLSDTLPDGWRVEWTASNGNFDMEVSSDAKTCKISPKKNGNTTFTATVCDANGNAVSSDEQVMTSKAGFFDKIIAFFKKLFGLTKVIPQSLKYIY